MPCKVNSYSSIDSKSAAGSHVDEDKAFGMLHTHIDELTREKFELARGLTKQQEMSASLAQENQRLLDDYNDQVDDSCVRCWHILSSA